MKRPTIRHIIRIAEGKLITIEGERRVEANYQEFHRLNTVTALETAFKGMGFRLISEMADEVIYQKSIKGGANPMMKTCTVPGCNQPRMTNRKGKPLTMCEAHQKEYWREHKSSRNGSGKRGRKSAAAPVLPPPNSRRIFASSRCAAPSAGSNSPTPTKCSMSQRTPVSAAAARTQLRS